MIVLDSSVALKWVLPEEHADKAVAIRDDYRNGMIELIAPDVFPIEVASALTKAERKGAINPSEAILKLADVLSNSPRLFPYRALLSRATDISSQFRVATYDCLYAALAQRENAELVTADLRIFNVLHHDFAIRLLSTF